LNPPVFITPPPAKIWLIFRPGESDRAGTQTMVLRANCEYMANLLPETQHYLTIHPIKPLRPGLLLCRRRPGHMKVKFSVGSRSIDTITPSPGNSPYSQLAVSSRGQDR
jgi:hypothetical protein